MMGTQAAPAQLFYDFCLENHVPTNHPLRRVDHFLDLATTRSTLKPFYSTMGRPSIDPDLMMRMLIVGYPALTQRVSEVQVSKRRSEGRLLST
jgi:transposase